jgi:hypothetical protein
MKIRFAVAAAAAVLAMSAGVATASAAPTNPHALAAHAAHHGKGFLGLTVLPGVEVFLPPGKAVTAAQTACANVVAHPPLTVAPVGTVLVQPAVLTVDAVRAAFPAPVAVCTGVTLRSLVAADVVEV